MAMEPRNRIARKWVAAGIVVGAFLGFDFIAPLLLRAEKPEMRPGLLKRALFALLKFFG